ncbi:hypothetical protein B9T25_00790 [Acinetobacter sp. ANC 4470]|uniref:hypothetical protein n=1 Tax=Acinetobacter sp. ANC 4470 TaxID=1977881 RepID=UPI000A356C38|nr:hypothetical protein [Acinetobacter sp. ANC 4470]OTG69171.1 hypothetical protein B9T25_00790 [Acinetobacter sp. ANC 4470]
MSINPNITTSGQLKLTQSEINYLRQFLEANDRGGYYLALPKSLYDIDDLYVQKDSKGKVLTLIKCEYSEYPLVRICEQKFVLEPEMKVRILAVFQSVHLQDWQFIQQQAKTVVLGFIVKPENFKRE